MPTSVRASRSWPAWPGCVLLASLFVRPAADLRHARRSTSTFAKLQQLSEVPRTRPRSKAVLGDPTGRRKANARWPLVERLEKQFPDGDDSIDSRANDAESKLGRMDVEPLQKNAKVSTGEPCKHSGKRTAAWRCDNVPGKEANAGAEPLLPGTLPAAERRRPGADAVHRLPGAGRAGGDAAAGRHDRRHRHRRPPVGGAAMSPVDAGKLSGRRRRPVRSGHGRLPHAPQHDHHVPVGGDDAARRRRQPVAFAKYRGDLGGQVLMLFILDGGGVRGGAAPWP